MALHLAGWLNASSAASLTDMTAVLDQELTSTSPTRIVVLVSNPYLVDSQEESIYNSLATSANPFVRSMIPSPMQAGRLPFHAKFTQIMDTSPKYFGASQCGCDLPQLPQEPASFNAALVALCNQ
jgi:hypothetical protein